MSTNRDNGASGSPLSGKKILLGISGGISAYKSAFLTRILKREGADVWVCMTHAGTKFITPLTMESLSEREVLLEIFPEKRVVGTRHITIAEWADAVIIAPATADLLARMRAGIANDMLTTLLISTEAPVFVAPTMNTRMYDHPATQENMDVLRDRGVRFIAPGVGELACKTVGMGRMAEPEEIAGVLRQHFGRAADLKGRRIMVTAGPTQEPLDPVRFLSNRSSGKMGFRIAEAAAARGADVVLISGPVNLPDVTGVKMVRVITADEMKSAVEDHFETIDAVIMAAAVADFRPTGAAPGKIKKTSVGKTLEIEKTPDILQEMGQQKKNQILAGFSLETDNLAAEAGRKLRDKNLDLVVANNPTIPGSGFDAETNVASIIDRDGNCVETGKILKRELAEIILDRIVELLRPQTG